MKIILTQEDFETLVNGQVVRKGINTEIILQDMEFSFMERAIRLAWERRE